MNNDDIIAMTRKVRNLEAENVNLRALKQIANAKADRAMRALNDQVGPLKHEVRKLETENAHLRAELDRLNGSPIRRAVIWFRRRYATLSGLSA